MKTRNLPIDKEAARLHNSPMSTAKQFEPSTSIGGSPDQLWDKRRLAQFLGVSIATVDRWTSHLGGGPPYVKVGDLVRFVPADVQAFVAERRKK